jgi:hypothetical protein
MTDTEINIAIAEKCGWTKSGLHHWAPPKKTGLLYHRNIHEIPNYCTDLNAMHEAEKCIPTNWLIRWELQLVSITCGGSITDAFNKREHWSVKAIAQATARQRAEAFLRVFGLWK